jgi:hypothetical protein
MDFPYLSGFDDQADVLKQFEEPAAALDGAELLYACYESYGYDGSAIVVFRKDGELFLVSGGHCSCYGLSDEWSAEPTTLEALRMFRYDSYEGWNKFIEALGNESERDYKSDMEGTQCAK